MTRQLKCKRVEEQLLRWDKSVNKIIDTMRKLDAHAGSQTITWTAGMIRHYNRTYHALRLNTPEQLKKQASDYDVVISRIVSKYLN